MQVSNVLVTFFVSFDIIGQRSLHLCGDINIYRLECCNRLKVEDRQYKSIVPMRFNVHMTILGLVLACRLA